jgi:hypothetical protein
MTIGRAHRIKWKAGEAIQQFEIGLIVAARRDLGIQTPSSVLGNENVRSWRFFRPGWPD